MEQVIVHCDGSCLGNGGANARAGWGLVVTQGPDMSYCNGGKVPGEQTSIRAEIHAFLQALLYIKESAFKDVIIATDSYEVVMAVTGKIKRSSNRDMWALVEEESKQLLCRNILIKHCNKKELAKDDIYYIANVQADALAFEGANKLFNLLED